MSKSSLAMHGEGPDGIVVEYPRSLPKTLPPGRVLGTRFLVKRGGPLSRAAASSAAAMDRFR